MGKNHKHIIRHDNDLLSTDNVISENVTDSSEFNASIPILHTNQETNRAQAKTDDTVTLAYQKLIVLTYLILNSVNCKGVILH